MKILPRTFKYNGIVLEDPDPEMDPEEVKDFYANIYPELTQAIIEEPEQGDDSVEYTFRRSYGTKGITVTDLLENKTDRQENTPPTDIMQLIGGIVYDIIRNSQQKNPLPSIVLEPI